jgi:hypothetical protein
MRFDSVSAVSGTYLFHPTDPAPRHTELHANVIFAAAVELMVCVSTRPGMDRRYLHSEKRSGNAETRQSLKLRPISISAFIRFMA